MVKKVSKHSKQEIILENEKVESIIKPEEKKERENEIEQGLIVKIKKENDIAIKKSIKKMELAVKQNIDMKQVISAVKSLQEYFKQSKK